MYSNEAEHVAAAHYRQQRTKVIDYVVYVVALALVPVMVLTVYGGQTYGWTYAEIIQIGVISTIWLLATHLWKLTPDRRAAVIAGLLICAGVADVAQYGFIALGLPYLIIIPVLAAAIGGMRSGLVSLGAIALALVGVAYRTVVTQHLPNLDFPNYFVGPTEWAATIFNLSLVAGIGVFAIGSLHHLLASANKDLRMRNRDLRQAQSKASHSSALANLGHASGDVMTGVILECDEIYAKLHGMSVADFKALNVHSAIIQEMVHFEDRPNAIIAVDALKRGEPQTCEFRHILPSGETRYLRKILAPDPLFGRENHTIHAICQDVTEPRKLQDQLFQAQKMQSIGQLTGGVAHDFNNLLGVILGTFEHLRDNTKDTRELDLIQDGINATLRGSELTSNMLSFAQKAPLRPTKLNLNDHIRNLNVWTERTLPSSITVRTTLVEGLWPIELDASLAESAILNLILNARDAMPTGGSLTLETSNVRVDRGLLDHNSLPIRPGPYVLLQVQDDGVGIPPEDLKRVFEPFFTTKSAASGSGLGLSMLEGFMKQSGGTLRVLSELGKGTTFELYFSTKAKLETPISPDHPAAKATPTKAAPAKAPVLQATDPQTTILLVEDNESVRKIVSLALSTSGYTVLEASSGDAAVPLFQNHPEIDVVLTDMVMPGELQGISLAQRLRDIRPALPVVFMSGYAEDTLANESFDFSNEIFLLKPIARADLLDALSKSLHPLQRGLSPA